MCACAAEQRPAPPGVATPREPPAPVEPEPAPLDVGSEDLGACAPPRFVGGAPAPVSQDVAGLVALLREPETTLEHVERDFGALIRTPHAGVSFELARPPPGAQRVTISGRIAQGREYLHSLDVYFPPDHQPALQELATRLDAPGALQDEVSAACTHGRCPSVSTGRGEVGRDQRLLFYFDERAPVRYGQRPSGRLGVHNLYVSDVRGGCRIGRPVAAPLRGPRALEERSLAQAIRGAAALIQREPIDEDAVTELLAPYGRVTITSNAISKFAWVRFFPEVDVAPICVDAAAYVQDPALLCHVTQHERHLYEFAGDETHRVFAVVDHDDDVIKRTRRVSFVELLRMPRGWEHPVF